ncbi:MAG: MDR family MFS transporter [Bacillota bacterium]|nr:MDR family MFS transporter [Bacillota bacterium]
MDSKKRNIVISIMIAMFLGAVEGTIITTAIPTIGKELSGLELISWVFSLYLLTSAISTPIYGKLSDLYGRKSTLSVGIVIFLIGSCLCGLSQNMYQLIGFRALQGLGAGAIFTVTYTIVGDVFTLSERAKVQGWVSSVWGIASLAGPFVGGFLIDTLSWHWIFFINIPFGILCIVLLQRNLTESFEKRKHKIDYLGAIVLSLAIISILNGIFSSENSGGMPAYVSELSIALGLALLVAFYFVERKAGEPIVPFEIFTRINTIVNVISLLSSAVLIGIDVYMPIYIQNILGYSPTISGLAMAPMSISWLLSSIILGKAIPRYGEKVVTVFSMLILLVSCALLPTLGTETSLIPVIIYSFIMGFGFGGSFTTLTIVVQSSVDYTRRGAATASNSLLRTLGQTIGVSIFGSIFNLNIVRYFSNLGIRGVDPNKLYSALGTSENMTLYNIKASQISGIHVIFLGLIIIAAVCLMLTFTLKSSLKEEVM